MWSLGVTTYVLLTGYLPFENENKMIVFCKIKSADYTWNGLPCVVSDTAKDFVDKCLMVDPDKRISARDALKHSFLAISTTSEE